MITATATKSAPPLGHDALAVANYLLDLGDRDGIPIDPLKLQKLIYFCHGWHLALTGQPLVYQTIVAWPYGPIVRDVYRQFREYGGTNISGRATLPPDWETTFERTPLRAEFSPETADVIDRVWKVFKDSTGTELSAMSHTAGSPWHTVAGHKAKKEIRDLPISDALIRDYFRELGRRKSDG